VRAALGVLACHSAQGLYATLGAAAMLSGSGRVALFISAVMVEITNDTEFIPPLVLATFVAAIVGNRFNRASR
jgi:chloride channel 7